MRLGSNGFVNSYCQRICKSIWHQRKFFSAAFTTAQHDQVQVPVGSRGSVALDIHHPPKSPSNANPVIIYLPRGPLTPITSAEALSLTPLASSANTTVVRVNYRLSKDCKYPTPIHDTLAAYDWVVRYLVHGVDGAVGNIGVCGELIGGSLAAALALTECHQHKTGVRALVVGNPVCDWTAMVQVTMQPESQKPPDAAPSGGRKKRSSRPPSWVEHAFSKELSAQTLLKARHTLFRSPEDYFDTFASPALFFRTPGISVPQEIDPLDELFATSDIKQEQATKKRKSHRRYPPMISNLQLPHTRLWVGNECVLMDQGIELAEGIARSNHMYGGPCGAGEGTGWENVEVRIKDGLGTWGDSEHVEMGSWLGEILRLPP